MADTHLVSGRVNQPYFASVPINSSLQVRYKINGKHKLRAIYVSTHCGNAVGTPAAATIGVHRVLAFVGRDGGEVDLTNAAITSGLGQSLPAGIQGTIIGDGFVPTPNGNSGPSMPIPLNWVTADDDEVTVVVGAVVRDSDGSSNAAMFASVCLIGDSLDEVPLRV